MIEGRDIAPRIDRLLAIVLLSIAVGLLAMQSSSLFVFPLPNSLRWFGDETWLMLEAKSQMTTGVVRYPLAIGSALEQSKGVVLSMTWLSSLLYGTPVAILHADPVDIGRIVTATLAVLLCAALFICAKRMGASRYSAALAVLLLISSRSFFFASHSCRTDLLAGLIVLCVVSILGGMIKGQKRPEGPWWLWFGAAMTFLAVSSSIHLLTLLAPVSLYFVWRLGGFAKMTNILRAGLGCACVLIVFISLYRLSVGNLSLFSPSSVGHTQFHDVLSSIPILRPFSRSVQTSNILIRIRQFTTEAPQAYLLLLLTPCVGPLGRIRKIWSSTILPDSFAWPVVIVLLSWLLLEGAEVNYLIQVLPLFVLLLAIVASKAISYSPRFTYGLLTLIGSIFFVLALRDSLAASAYAGAIDSSNASAITQIEAAITRTWTGHSKPRVVTEPPTLERLTQATSIEVMTDHFISFPLREEPLDSFVKREHIDYFVLYNSPVYPKNRSANDPFYQDVKRLGSLQATIIGTSGDVSRDYFHNSNWKDTLLLIKVEDRHGRN